jgi:polysaccharide export outer membrane protein
MKTSLLIIGLSLLCATALSGCASVKKIPVPDAGREYTLAAGDKIMVNVYNQDKLSGEFTISANGRLALPLLGKMDAQGMTTSELEEQIALALSPKYLNDPKVSVQVANYRNVFVLGEVNQPGRYEYLPDMTVLQAVATAEGYTPRASEGSVTIHRQVDKEIHVFDQKEDSLIKSGDVVVIDRRWF